MLALLLALTIQASPASVTWAGAGGGCVYLVEAGGARWRLGCSASASYTPTPGTLYAGDVVEVRALGASGRVTGRVVVE